MKVIQILLNPQQPLTERDLIYLNMIREICAQLNNLLTAGYIRVSYTIPIASELSLPVTTRWFLVAAWGDPMKVNALADWDPLFTVSLREDCMNIDSASDWAPLSANDIAAIVKRRIAAVPLHPLKQLSPASKPLIESIMQIRDSL